jgi:hypothetical protein
MEAPRISLISVPIWHCSQKKLFFQIVTASVPFWHGPFWKEGIGDDETGIGGQGSGIGLFLDRS